MNRLSTGLKTAGFVLLNVWLAFHVFAIFISPAGMPPASPLLVDAASVARPYNQVMFLNHGYHYFAPDPGASTLISYAVEKPGDVPVKGRFPTTDIWPRLLYHRYFMLAENLGAFHPEMQDDVYAAYAKHFAKQNNSDSISLSLLRHHPSSISRIQAGGKLSDPETFEEEFLATYNFAKTDVQLVPAPIDESLPVADSSLPASSTQDTSTQDTSTQDTSTQDTSIPDGSVLAPMPLE